MRCGSAETERTPVASRVITCGAGKCCGTRTHTHTHTHRHTHAHCHHGSSFQRRNQWVDSPRGRCARGMIPPLRILIGFQWLRWSAGHLPNHPTLMTWLDMLIDSIEGASKDVLQPPLLRWLLCAASRAEPLPGFESAEGFFYAHTKQFFNSTEKKKKLSLAGLWGRLEFGLIKMKRIQ